jgi:hypothetical protein
MQTVEKKDQLIKIDTVAAEDQRREKQRKRDQRKRDQRREKQHKIFYRICADENRHRGLRVVIHILSGIFLLISSTFLHHQLFSGAFLFIGGTLFGAGMLDAWTTPEDIKKATNLLNQGKLSWFLYHKEIEKKPKKLKLSIKK